jgi:hypothetical protein
VQHALNREKDRIEYSGNVNMREASDYVKPLNSPPHSTHFFPQFEQVDIYHKKMLAIQERMQRITDRVKVMKRRTQELMQAQNQTDNNPTSPRKL